MNGQAQNRKMKPGYSAPMKETPATLRDIIQVKSALAVLLDEEALFMDTMQIAKVRDLQDRKLKLIGLLERYLRYLNNHPELHGAITPEDKNELKKVMDTFNKAMRKNYNTLLVARAVNGAIVKCITQTVTKKESNTIYNARGASMTAGIVSAPPLSVTLNQTV